MNNNILSTFRYLSKGLLKLQRVPFGRKKKDKEPMDQLQADLDKPTQTKDRQLKKQLQEISGFEPAVQLTNETDMESQVTRQDIIKIQQVDVKRTSQLYQKFLKTQQRPLLTRDKYQFNFGLILHRLPIFLPYNKHLVKRMRQRYALIKRTPYHNSAPKGMLQNNTITTKQQADRLNMDNRITHLKKIDEKNSIMYAEHSKYWKLADSNIQDHSSIQYKPAEMLFLLIKNQNGQWTFPNRPVKERETYDTIKKNLLQDITGISTAQVFWLSQKPIFVQRQQLQMERGKGIKTFYFPAVHLTGTLTNTSQLKLWKQHAWVPKGQLATYLTPDYFNKIIRSVAAIM